MKFPSLCCAGVLARRSLAVLALICAGWLSRADAAGFEYRGMLYAFGEPAQGTHTLRLTPYSAAEGGIALAKPVVLHAVDVDAGSFSADLDFGVLPPSQERAWLQVEVADAQSGDFFLLPARDPVSLKATAACWSTAGNAGTDGAVDFIGTTDAQPLTLAAGGTWFARFTPAPSGFPDGNVALGTQAFVTDGASRSTIGGGTGNIVAGEGSTVAGGLNNRAGISPDATKNVAFATVSGGTTNFGEGSYSSITGGSGNRATGDHSIAGGSGNRALGQYSAAFGGVNIADGIASFAVGNANCAGGAYSAALGRLAKVRARAGSPGCLVSGMPDSGDTDGDEGTFVWADTTSGDFVSTGPNQFLVRAAGGMKLNTNQPYAGADLTIKGSNNSPADVFLVSGQAPAAGTDYVAHRIASEGTASGSAKLRFVREVDAIALDTKVLAEFLGDGRFRVYTDNPIKPTAGGWSAPSDARLKLDIEPLHGALDRLLQLEGVTYRYREDVPAGYYAPGTHTGFVAQQVEQVFPEWISTDADGYRLVGPQGFEALAVESLRELREEHRVQIAALRDEHAAALAQRDGELAQLRELIAQLSRDQAALVTRLERADAGSNHVAQVADRGSIPRAVAAIGGAP